MRYYGEYIDAQGNFQNMFFNEWVEWHDATFDPRCKVLVIRDTMTN